MGESKTMKRIRVLHSELNGELGGIESFLYNVYRFIDKEKVEFDFLTISDTPAYGDKFKKMGSTVYKVPKHINFLGYYFAIDKILREGNYDIVHEENGRCEAAEVAALCLANLYNSGGHRKITPDESAITHHSIQSINTPSNPSSTPLITPTLRSASGQGERPGSRTLRGSNTTR